MVPLRLSQLKLGIWLIARKARRDKYLDQEQLGAGGKGTSLMGEVNTVVQEMIQKVIKRSS